MLRKPAFVCVVCNRCLYRNGVKFFDYDFDTESVIHNVNTREKLDLLCM